MGTGRGEEFEDGVGSSSIEDWNTPKKIKVSFVSPNKLVAFRTVDVPTLLSLFFYFQFSHEFL